jgi:hypothetical protein
LRLSFLSTTNRGGRRGDEEAEGASGGGGSSHACEGKAEEEDLARQVTEENPMLFQRLLQILRVKWFFRKR